MMVAKTLPKAAATASSTPAGLDKKKGGVLSSAGEGLAAAGPAVMAQVYTRLRGATLKILVPLLCAGCKEALALASTKQPLPPGCQGLCKTCKLTLVMKHIPLSNADKAVENATSLIKARVISEIEGLLGRTVMRPPTPPPSPKRSRFSESEDDEKQLAEPKKELELPLSADLPIYDAFTAAGVDWCRYCGTTAGTSWKKGPWGARTLCFRHGRDWALHGRLDLSQYAGKKERRFPVLQSFCKICWNGDGIVRRCHGCANGFHAQCYLQRTSRTVQSLLVSPWYCNSTCPKHFETGSLRVTHSTKDRLPLMGYEADAEASENGADEMLAEEAKDTLELTLSSTKLAPIVLFRLKAPERPVTPIPTNVTIIELPAKRRFSCPTQQSSSLLKPVVKKVRRSRDHSVPDFLISIDHTALPKRVEETTAKPSVLIPEFKRIQRPPTAITPRTKSTHQQEKMGDLAFEMRHARFEELEKHTRLLKPDVLKSLYGKAA